MAAVGTCYATAGESAGEKMRLTRHTHGTKLNERTASAATSKYGRARALRVCVRESDRGAAVYG